MVCTTGICVGCTIVPNIHHTSGTANPSLRSEQLGYADDTQLCLSFKKTSDNAIVKREILNLEKCLCDISVWMSQNKLKLNNDKTEIILFGSKKHLAELNINSLSVAGTDVSVASEPVRNLGAMFDSQLIMAPHVKSVVKTSSFHLRNIGKARRVLRARLVDYLFPMSKVLKIRVGRSGKKKKRQKYL